MLLEMELQYSTESLKEACGWEFLQNPEGFSFETPETFLKVSLLRNDHIPVALAAGVVYILGIFALQNYMKERNAFNLKWPLFWWNLSLGVFSIAGFNRTAPALLQTMIKDGVYVSICVRKGVDYPTLFWAYLFGLSKFVEFGDTVFIVLRKRPLKFLQWFHHVTTMVFCWTIGGPYCEPVIRWFMVLNFGVHSLMYPYFAMKVAGISIPRWNADVITTLQFAQMIVGLVVNIGSIYFKDSGYPCYRESFSINMSCFLYGSFFFLFGKLFVESVLTKRRLKRKDNWGAQNYKHAKSSKLKYLE